MLKLYVALFALGALGLPSFAQPPVSPGVSGFPMKLSRSYLGVGVREIDATRAKELKLKEEAGVEITQIDEDSPAARAALKVNDVVLEYNGQRVEGSEQFSRMVRETPAGRNVKLQVSRDGSRHNLTATIGTRNAPHLAQLGEWNPANIRMHDVPRPVMMWHSRTFGIEAEPLRGQFAEYFGVKEGVLVRKVEGNTSAAKAGLKAGDVILKVGEEFVTSPGELTAAIRKRRPEPETQLTIFRDRKETKLNITLGDEKREGSRQPHRER